MFDRTFLETLFRIDAGNPDLVRSQLDALRRQIPILHGLLGINTIVFATTHLGSFPIVLGVVVPCVLCALACLCGVSWLKLDVQAMSHRARVDKLIETSLVAPAAGAVYAVWTIALSGYVDGVGQAHLLFNLAVTVLGAGFCLVQLKSAAVSVPLSAGLPLLAYLSWSGNPLAASMLSSFLIVSSASVALLWRHFDDFAALVDAKARLVAEQRERRHLSDENERLANLDSLTGQPNRRRFMAELDAAVSSGAPFVVGLIGLDGFKAVNDLHGHAVGDELLIEASYRLCATCDEDVLVARVGGDEFGILIPGEPSEKDLLVIGGALCETLQVPFTLGDVTAQVSGSIGFAAFPTAGLSAEALFERADHALCHAKTTRPGTAVIFSDEHETEIREFSRLEQALRHADFDAEFSLAYQPIHDIHNGRTVSFEALARWNSPTVGVIAPTDFIPVAERINVIGRLTEILLRKALADAKHWTEATGLSFNLSVQDVVNADAVLRIISTIMASGIDPKRIDLEVTETALMRDFDQACDGLEALRRLGVRISLDDFGSGYSSLSHLHRLPVDRIKIDRSFVQDLGRLEISRDILVTMANLCRNLKLSCVVEGVETEAQLNILHELGFTTIQGYYFGTPMLPETIPVHLAEEGVGSERSETALCA